jgi:hypothetical protein
VYAPMRVRVLTGEATKTNFDLIAYARGINIPLALGSARAAVYTVKSVPQESLWFLSGNGEEYVLVGGVLKNAVGATKLIRGVGIATGFMEQLFVERIIATQAGVYAP